MKEQLITLLETFGFPVFLQGSLASPGDYPESFFTFWLFSAPEESFYSGNPLRCVWGFWVYFYSTDPVQVCEQSEAARQLLKQNGYITEGKPTDVPVDVPTHTGMFFIAYKPEEYNVIQGGES